LQDNPAALAEHNIAVCRVFSFAVAMFNLCIIQ